MHTPDAALPLSLTVAVDGTQLSMALSDAHALGRIASCQVNSALLQALQTSTADPCTLGPLLFEKLFPEKIRTTLQHSASRSISLQLDETLLGIPWEMAFDGSQFLGEKFQVTRHLLSGHTVKRSTRTAPRRESLRVLLLQGPHCSPAQEAYCAALTESILFVEGLEVTLVHSHTVEHSSLLKLVHDSDVVHGIGTGDSIYTPPYHHEAGHAAQLWVLDLAGSHTSMLRHGANLLVHQDVDDTPLHVDCMRTLYRALAQGGTLGASVHQARHHRHHQPDASAARPWTCALYGDASLVLHPAMERAGLDDNLRQVTAVSCDLVGSTHLLDTWGAERYSEVLDTYHTVCAGVVSRWGGISDKPQGDDGIMCYFGVPLAYEDSVARALRAGLEILETVTQLGVQVRLGVVTGNVVVKSG